MKADPQVVEQASGMLLAAYRALDRALKEQATQYVARRSFLSFDLQVLGEDLIALSFQHINGQSDPALTESLSDRYKFLMQQDGETYR